MSAASSFAIDSLGNKRNNVINVCRPMSSGVAKFYTFNYSEIFGEIYFIIIDKWTENKYR